MRNYHKGAEAAPSQAVVASGSAPATALNAADQRLYVLLEEGLQASAMTPLPQAIKVSLVRYLRLLAHWNRAYNLTAVRSPADMVARHLLDALSVMPYLRGQQMLDVGTGAGVPGLILAIADPSRKWLLLDARRKKIRFCRHAAAQLGVSSHAAFALHGRIETFSEAQAPDWDATAGVDVIVSRATFSIPQLLAKTRHLWRTQTRIIAMKTSAVATAELDSLKLSARIQVLPATYPQRDSDRRLVLIDGLQAANDFVSVDS